MRELARQALISLRATAFLLVACCVVYPVVVFALGHAVMPHLATGSLVDKQGDATSPDRAAGSSLLGQAFHSAYYFHPRPSAAGAGYDAASSSGTNLGPLSEKLLDGSADDPSTKDVDESFAGVKQLVLAYRAENQLGPDVLVPADAVTYSASGLDPDITPANARLQIARVAAARGARSDEVRAIVERHITGRSWGVFGEPRVNVLELNTALDRELPVAGPIAREHGSMHP
jgi:K+-transporting ATPase ATPase C chain